MATCSIEGCENEATTHTHVSGKKIFICNSCSKDLKDSKDKIHNERLNDVDEKLNAIDQRILDLEEKFKNIKPSDDNENNASKSSGFIKYGKN